MGCKAIDNEVSLPLLYRKNFCSIALWGSIRQNLSDGRSDFCKNAILRILSHVVDFAMFIVLTSE